MDNSLGQNLLVTLFSLLKSLTLVLDVVFKDLKQHKDLVRSNQVGRRTRELSERNPTIGLSNVRIV